MEEIKLPNTNKIYISGPVTGVVNYSDNFKNAEKFLKNNGYVAVINPTKANDILPQEYTSYEEYMSIDIALLNMCNSIYMLKGWENSRGANREYGYALAKGMNILFEE